MRNYIRQPNIVILILDAVRAKNLSAYGYPVATTPNLEAFAAESVLFKRAFAPATWTIPTHTSLLTGLYLSQHRIESTRADRRCHDDIVALPEVLGRQGYRTAGFSSNILFSPSQHFDTFHEFYEFDTLIDSHRSAHHIGRFFSRFGMFGNHLARYLRKVLTPRLMLGDIETWVEARTKTEEPYLVVANLANVHYPWALPPGDLLRNLHFHPRYLLRKEYATLSPFAFNSERRQVLESHRRVWRSLYDAALMHVDRELGRFLRRILRRKDTIVVITADHGEMLGDYRNLVGHTLSLHDNLIHVPLIVRHPEYPAGLKVEGIVQNMDLYSSVLDWASVPLHYVHPAQIQRPALASAVAAPHELGGYAFAEEDYTDSYNPLRDLLKMNPSLDPQKYPQRQVAIRSATHKYILCNNRAGEFYNLVFDPDEMHNSINTIDPAERATLAKLQDTLQAWQAGMEIFRPQIIGNSLKANDILTEHLRALGYVA